MDAAPKPPLAVWQPLGADDMAALVAIADVVHPALPERPEVLAEKLRLFPAGCRKRVAAGRMVGYALAHPWRVGDPPQLDTFLGALPAHADCLFIHDIALLPQARGAGAAAALLEHLLAIAAARALPALCLIAAYGTSRLWRRHGFEECAAPALTAKLAAYGADVVYMVRAAPPP